LSVDTVLAKSRGASPSSAESITTTGIPAARACATDPASAA